MQNKLEGAMTNKSKFLIQQVYWYEKLNLDYFNSLSSQEYELMLNASTECYKKEISAK
jgi:hypothetical protein